MGNTIYASFTDAGLAEKAAGALLDNGVRPEDLSLVRNPGDSFNDVAPYSSTSGQDSINRQLDTITPDSGSQEYSNTGGSETWSGSGAESEGERHSYTGSVYGTPAASTMTAEEVANSNVGYGDTSYREANLNDDPGKTKEPADYERAAKAGISTTTGSDAGAGAIKGTGWGLGVGILAGIASLAVPGVGLVLGAGALAAAIGAAAATAGAGAIAGGLIGYLKDQGMEEHVAAQYNNTLQNGGALIAVTLPSGNVDEEQAREILEKYGAGNVGQYAARGYVA